MDGISALTVTLFLVWLASLGAELFVYRRKGMIAAGSVSVMLLSMIVALCFVCSFGSDFSERLPQPQLGFTEFMFAAICWSISLGLYFAYVSISENLQSDGSLENDDILLCLAFVFALIYTVACALMLLFLPLIWMVPMTIRCWRICRNESRNTVAFGLCSLIFLNPITGMLLLCARRNG